ncbi:MULTISPECIES: cytochrome o ubiquinol oxidase subunit III [Brevibacillus]|jgi:cytochrome o ubiquinol oxidase subunit 3|uniref:Cytochrome bo(3) ubiquinol oxidase subunit 3 n=1 Tax=Brevibacillus borstelensis AK1 TaxID=1300222 RepID=M8DAD9_9BACL|nr:cytochrome o ubiquinol oxidase subunit III [Brevibacillus borstelensis]EMT53234.1 quinol oxidase polypeptide III [Brevibacillus borstelensis AK1]KKX55379.1 cytochrome o ubiquinol oxidase subunit III [Brevibacillus borstelensis cifa_chp40]MBE5397659.1 cytochrome o ubiquinol oxidase subunit III [Brevibacillus borstelensis]MCC0563659.1 cytochrome o ubiquinol oxidase subunit III [Brevibacillus borstelensis]MCM3469303.1 cytochrome o ubiquinol oxidase subunit III [Brevibacillus borstelensis]
MQQVAKHHDHSHGHDHDHGHEDHEQLKVLGFWIFVVTDCILFGTLFATYAVLMHNYAGGPTPKELFQMPGVIAETFILLTSSFTSGLAVLAMNKGNVKKLIGWLVVTALLGLGFIALEVTEFVHMVHEGATISTSAFLSAFYTLVGTHGLHVSVGLFWMVAIMIQLARRGITPVTRRKVTNLSLYWHFLDVVWIFLFTVVYLLGVM